MHFSLSCTRIKHLGKVQSFIFQYGVRLAVLWNRLIEVKMYAGMVRQTSLLAYYKPIRPFDLTTKTLYEVI